jgi:thioredoxin 1
MTDLLLVDDANFETEVLKASLPVLVDFSAAWCGPCKMIDPLLKELAEGEWKDKIKVVKINADESTETVTRCGVMGLPTLLLFKSGKMVDDFRIMGYKPKKKMQEEVEEYLA